MASDGPDVFRYRPAIFVAIAVAAATSIYLLRSSFQPGGESQTPNLQRRNAVRRPARAPLNGEAVSTTSDTQNHSPTVVHDEDASIIESPPDTIEIEDAATEASYDGNEEGPEEEEGQKLRELMFAISKNRAKTEGFIHRSVTCDNCGRLPIVGIRYHCTNCPDFDLCEDCEAQECHLRTHIFYKVRIPASWGGKCPTAVWYPGRPQDMPVELDRNIKKRLIEKTKLKSNKIDGLYYQFSCLANQPLEPDACGIGMGIDTVAFNKCFVAQVSYKDHPYANLVHDRLFKFFDSDNDGLISFEEFLMGLVLARSEDRKDRKLRLFRCLDLDDDGYICRKDVLRFYRANFTVNKNIMVEYYKADRYGERAERVNDRTSIRDFINSGRPLSSYFVQGSADFNQTLRIPALKTQDEFGDLMPIDGSVSIMQDDKEQEDLMSTAEVISGKWINTLDLLAGDIHRAIEKRELGWTTADDIKAFELSALASPGTNSDGLLPCSKLGIITYEGEWWLCFRYAAKRVACLRVLEADIVEVLGVAALENENWKDDARSFHHITAAVQERISHKIRAKLKITGAEKLKTRRQNSRFYLEERRTEHLMYVSDEDSDSEHSDRSSKQKSQSVSGQSQVISQALAGTNSQFPKRTSSLVKIDSSRSGKESERQELPFLVGDSQAAHTIFEVTQQTLNELLDPVFKQAEDLAAEIDRTRKERIERRHEFKRTSKEVDDTVLDLIITKKWENIIERVFDCQPWKHASAEAEAEELLTKLLGSTASKISANKWNTDERELLKTLTEALSFGGQAYTKNLLKGSTERLEKLQSVRSSFYHQRLASHSSFTLAAPTEQSQISPDPTMPQNRPNSYSLSVSNPIFSSSPDPSHRPNWDYAKSSSPSSTPSISKPLPMWQVVTLNNKEYEMLKKGIPPGHLDYEEFDRQIDIMDQLGESLIGWMSAWLDLIMF